MRTLDIPTEEKGISVKPYIVALLGAENFVTLSYIFRIYEARDTQHCLSQ